MKYGAVLSARAYYPDQQRMDIWDKPHYKCKLAVIHFFSCTLLCAVALLILIRVIHVCCPVRQRGTLLLCHSTVLYSTKLCCCIILPVVRICVLDAVGEEKISKISLLDMSQALFDAR